jgi:hypothetical protein
MSRRTFQSFLFGATLLLALLGAPGPVAAQSLRGSQASLDRAQRVARDHDFTYIRDGTQVLRFAEAGYLVRVRSNRDFALHNVSFPYARPQVELFLRRLGSQYRNACGEQLVVTSLTRPKNSQPRNASPYSVHPTGMALDLRRSWSRACRGWLEDVLLYLESQGVLEATRERSPAHYHVSLFPRQYGRYVEQLLDRQASSNGAEAGVEYRVRDGDSLWVIARRLGTTVADLRRANGIRGSRIYAGQLLTVPSQ